ncbi:MAG: ABC transporter substrate-binding protein [Candidatus Limnocylindrales bacterium]
MIRSFIRLTAAAVLLVGACSSSGSTAAPGAASSANPSSGPVAITDAMGRQVTFASPPMRIVIAGKALFMVADAVYLFPEASSRVVALGSTVQNKLSFIPAIDPNYGSKTILDGTAGAEQIAAARPDVVLLKSSNADTLGKPLEALGVKVVYVDFETPDQYARDLGTLGRLFGDDPKAQQLISYFQQQTNSVTTAVARIEDAQKPRVLMLYYSNKNGTVAFNVPPLSYIQSTAVQLGGGQLVWKDAQLGNGWTTVTLEQIAAWDPDQIFVIVYSGNVNDVVTKLEADPQWQALDAVKRGAIYGFPGDYYSWDQPDPRWVLGLTWLAAKMHPDRFASLSMDAEIRSFYKDLYGMDDAAYDINVKPYLTGSLP